MSKKSRNFVPENRIGKEVALADLYAHDKTK